MTCNLNISKPAIRFLGARKAAVNRQAGVTLLELMIALSLGLLLLTGIGTIYVGSNQTYRVQEQNARIQEAGRFALETVGRSVRQAGYWDMPASMLALATSFTGTPITGTNGSGSASDAVTTQRDGIAGERDCEGTVLTATVVQEAIQRDATDLELVCESNRDGTIAVDPQPLVSNVEDLQIIYGLDTDGNQSANQYLDASLVTDWAQVVSVRVCVLVRSEDQGITNSAQKYLNCQGALGTVVGTSALTQATDSRLRRAFVATFNLRNRVAIHP